MISVIIPIFNVEKYIIQCIQSFQNQIYTDFELIIVDDGSTDNSAVLVNEYKKNSPMKITVITQKNAGVSVARNTGLDNALSEYICFVDGDDIVAPQYLSEMVNVLIDEKCDLVICGAKSIPENYENSLYTYEKNTIEIMNSYEALKKYLYRDIVSGVCFLMVKRAIIENNSLRFSNGYHYSEDQEMMWKIIANCKTIVYDKTELYMYRVRDGSAMSAVNDKRIDGMRLIQGLEGYFNEIRPDFSSEFNKYATARWVWATAWQIAVASKNYKAFHISSDMFSTSLYMRKLFTFPRLNVSISAKVYGLCPYLYYCIIKVKGRKRLNNREVFLETKVQN